MLKHPREIYAFTLAEVLITLGIIGIVAALTIPTLVNNYQKSIYVAKLKKFYTTQNNGWKAVLAADGVEILDDTALASSVNGSYDDPATGTALKAEYKKYFKAMVVTPPANYDIYYLNGDHAGDYSHNQLLMFPDGVVIDSGLIYKEATTSEDYSTIKSAGGHLFNTQIEQLIVDVNGFQKPNIVGRDVYFFVLSGDGILYPREGTDWAIFEGAGKWYQVNGCGTNTTDDTGISTSDGTGCAARIMESGWQMNY